MDLRQIHVDAAVGPCGDTWSRQARLCRWWRRGRLRRGVYPVRVPVGLPYRWRHLSRRGRAHLSCPCALARPDLSVIFCRGVRTDILLLTARVVVTEAGSLVNGPPTLPSELSGVRDQRMIIRMTTSRRPRQRYDHRLCDLVHNTGDVTIATNLGVPRSTARGWLRKAPRVTVSMEVTNLEAMELQQEILELR